MGALKTKNAKKDSLENASSFQISPQYCIPAVYTDGVWSHGKKVHAFTSMCL